VKSYEKIFISLLLVFASEFSFAGLPLPLPDDPHEQPPPVNEVTLPLATVQLDRFAENRKSVTLKKGQNRLTRLRLYGMRNNINIKAVRIYTTAPNSVREIWEMEGSLGSSEILEVPLNGLPISRVEVISTAGYFWKKPGGYRLEAGALR